MVGLNLKGQGGSQSSFQATDSGPAVIIDLQPGEALQVNANLSSFLNNMYVDELGNLVLVSDSGARITINNPFGSAAMPGGSVDSIIMFVGDNNKVEAIKPASIIASVSSSDDGTGTGSGSSVGGTTSVSMTQMSFVSVDVTPTAAQSAAAAVAAMLGSTTTSDTVDESLLSTVTTAFTDTTSSLFVPTLPAAPTTTIETTKDESPPPAPPPPAPPPPAEPGFVLSLPTLAVLGGTDVDGEVIGGTGGNDLINVDGAKFTTSSISNMKLWLDAHNINGDGSTVADSSSITTWVNLADSSKNMVAVGGFEPTYDVGYNANGRSTVDFTVDRLLSDPILAAGDDSYTIVAVWVRDNGSGFQAVYEQNHSSLVPGLRGSLLTVPGGGLYGYNGEFNDAHTIASNTLSTIEITVMTVKDQPGSNIVISDSNATGFDTRVGTVNIGTANLSASYKSGVGFKISTNSEHFDGKISEVMVFSDSIVGGDLTTIEDYISHKYNAAIVTGVAQQDTITGGTGYDVFSWSEGSVSTADAFADTVTDFNPDFDKIELYFPYQIQLSSTNIYSGAQNEMILVDAGSDVHVDIDWGTDNVSDFRVVLNNVEPGDLDSSHFRFHNVKGTGGDEEIYGTLGDDTLDGGAGSDILIGDAGDDILIYDAADNIVHGVTGDDTLKMTGAGETLNLLATTITLSDIERIDLRGSGANTLTANKTTLADLSSTTNTHYVRADATDIINLEAATWSLGVDHIEDSVTYKTYTAAGPAVTLYIEDIAFISGNINFS